MRIEAKDLQSALTEASKSLECSVIDLEYEIIQYSKNGFLGFWRKNAIIEARAKKQPYSKKILEKILMRPKMMFIEIMKNLTANSMIEVK